ncbi:MAG: flagellar biosynthesis repressor FlbT [Pseudomonadota bacterium]
MPLKLSLKPNEAVIVNGAVLRNGDRRGGMVLENTARVLREKDVLHPETLQTPEKRAYFALMQMYLTGETTGKLYEALIEALSDVLAKQSDDLHRQRALEVTRAAAAEETYVALSLARRLVKASDLAERGVQNG